MHQGLKKLAAFLLSALVAVPLFFTAGILVKQKIIQFQRKERLESETLQTISIPAEKIYWVKAGKEILADGKLFDVKHFKKQNNKIILTGFFDKEEDSLFSHLNKMAKDNNKPSPFATIISFLQTPVYHETPVLSLEIDWKPLSKHYFSFTEKIPSPPLSDIKHPPGA